LSSYPRILEVATFGVHEAISAQTAGAQRLEVCKNYSVGGISLSQAELTILKKDLMIPSFVMIRPRPGNFIYNENEILEMEETMQCAIDLGYNGFVFGALNENQTINLEHTNRLVEFAEGLPCTFHRAFDETPDYRQSIALLKQTGIKRILSAAGSLIHIASLVELQQIASPEITIIPGGSLRSNNILAYKEAGFIEFHTSAIPNPSKMTKPSATEIQTMLHLIS
jgi:copper homeostasis protein